MKKIVAVMLIAALSVVGVAGTALAKGKTGGPTAPGQSPNPNPGK